MLMRLFIRAYAAKPQSSVAAGGITGLGKKKALAKTGPTLQKAVLPVETDTYKLVTYCCGSDTTKMGQDVKLGDDSEYPEWLWKLNTGKPKQLEDLEYDTWEFWNKARKIGRGQRLTLLRLKKKWK